MHQPGIKLTIDQLGYIIVSFLLLEKCGQSYRTRDQHVLRLVRSYGSWYSSIVLTLTVTNFSSCFLSSVRYVNFLYSRRIFRGSKQCYCTYLLAHNKNALAFSLSFVMIPPPGHPPLSFAKHLGGV